MNNMKRIFTIIFILLVGVITKGQNPQDTICISFAASGNTHGISTVKVINLDSVIGNTGSVTLYGNNEKLLLVGDSLFTTGIKPLDVTSGLTVYPNPMNERSTLNFIATESGNAGITIFDISGKIIFQQSEYLLQGSHAFTISGVDQGMYLVKVTGKQYCYSAKLVSSSENVGNIKIEHLSFSPAGSYLKETNIIEDTSNKILYYKKGNRLEYKATSTTFGGNKFDKAVLMDVPTTSKTVTFNFVLCQDRDGNNYFTLTIVKPSGKSKIMLYSTSNDTIVWMEQNINVGDTVMGGTILSDTNGGIKKYCYNNDPNNCNIYGGLYPWRELMQFSNYTDTVEGICPSGWHVSSDNDWKTLMNFQNIDTSSFMADTVVGGKMKEIGTIHWNPPNVGATDSLGFTALGGGVWANGSLGNTFYEMGQEGTFYTSSYYNINFVTVYELVNYNTYLYRFPEADINPSHSNSAYSVRCVKNNW